MSSEMQTCSVCGGQVPAGSKFCQNCGHTMTPAGSSTEEIARVETQLGSNPMSQGPPTVNVSNQPAPSAPSYDPSAGAASWQPGQHGDAPQSQQAGQTTYIPPQTSYIGDVSPSSLPAPIQQYSQAPLGPGQQLSGGIIPAGMQRDPILALLLELVGYVFVLGLGHMYAGRVGRGIALMVGYWLYGGIAVLLFFTVLLSPIACLMALLHPVVPIVSGLWAKRDLDREREQPGGQLSTY